MKSIASKSPEIYWTPISLLECCLSCKANEKNTYTRGFRFVQEMYLAICFQAVSLSEVDRYEWEAIAQYWRGDLIAIE